MREADFTVSLTKTLSLDHMYREAGVPESLHGCHTPSIGDWTIEGHPPAAAITHLVEPPGLSYYRRVLDYGIGYHQMKETSGETKSYEIWAVPRSGDVAKLACACGIAPPSW